MTRAPNPRVIYPAWPSSECHTPEWLLALAHEVLGQVELDPATDNRNRARAARFFTLETNGLTSNWHPPNGQRPGPIWLNFPFGREAPLWTSLFQLYSTSGVPGLCLAPARIGARWYRALTEAAQAVCELDGRIMFEGPDGQPFRDSKGRPTAARWGCILAYYGPERARAQRILQRRGSVRLVAPYPFASRALERAYALERKGQLRLVE